MVAVLVLVFVRSFIREQAPVCCVNDGDNNNYDDDAHFVWAAGDDLSYCYY